MSRRITLPGDSEPLKVQPGDLIRSDLINAIIDNLEALNRAVAGAGTTGLVSVPNFVGRSLSDARAILSQATTHLNLGSVFDASGVGFSGAAPSVQTRLVVNQVPTPGSRVAGGTAVDLVLAVAQGGGTTPTSNRPTITSIVGARPGEVRVGDTATINGSNFDLTPGNNQVTFGDRPAPPPTSSNGNALVVQVPEVTSATGGQVNVTVRVPGRTPNDTSLPFPVTVLPRATQPQPAITGVLTPSGNPPNTVTEGDEITVNGTGFAASPARNRVFLHTVEVTPNAQRSTQTALVLTIPNTVSEALGMTGSGRRPLPIRVRNLDIEDPTRNTSPEFTGITLEM